MAARHMTDDEIQAYLETGTSALDQVFDSHLMECRSCRERVESYRAMFGALGEERGFELSPGFAEAVTARIAVEQAAGAKRRWQGILWSLLGVMASFAAMAVFMDLGAFWNRLAAVLGPSVEEGTRAFGETRKAVESFDGLQQTVASDGGSTLIIIVFCLLILGAVAGADHLLFRGRQAKYCL